MATLPLAILHVDSAREYRGGQNQVRLLMRGLERQPDVHQELLARDDSRLAAEARRLGVRVRGVDWRRAVDPSAFTALARECATDWDVVHAHDSHAVQSVLVARALGGGRTRVAASRRVEFASRRPELWRRADLIIAISNRVRDVLIRQGIERRRVTVVHSGIDPADIGGDDAGDEGGNHGEELRRLAGADADDLLVAAVGALSPEKDHRTFVRAAALLARQGHDMRFAVFGEGPERAALARLVEQEGIADRFALPGEVPGIAARLPAVDIFVMPSAEEGLGTACVEAMHAGVPIVATSAGGLADLAASGAFTPVMPGDASALARAIGLLAGDPDARLAAARASAAAAPEFSAERMVRGTLECYRALVGRWAVA